ncbi:MAG: hypothetical protein JXR03_19525 [Cyclobacteriaceae bacterium]
MKLIRILVVAFATTLFGCGEQCYECSRSTSSSSSTIGFCFDNRADARDECERQEDNGYKCKKI